MIHNGTYDRSTGKITQVRGLPTGQRMVSAKRGRKWVFIWRGKDRHRIKLNLADFDAIVLRSEQLPKALIQAAPYRTPTV